MNSRVYREFMREIELISPPNTRLFLFEICTLYSVSFNSARRICVHEMQGNTTNEIQQMKYNVI